MVNAEDYIAGLLDGLDDFAELMEERDLLVARICRREDEIYELQGAALEGEPSLWDEYREDLQKLSVVCITMASLEPAFDDAES